MTDSTRYEIRTKYRADERRCLWALVDEAALGGPGEAAVHRLALELTRQTRDRLRAEGGFAGLLQEYDLSSEEGVLLMCLAEALLRIPDAATADRLIEDKLSRGQWDDHLGHSHSLWVNASAWGLLVTGRVLDLRQASAADLLGRLRGLAARLGETATRVALRQGMRLLAGQFVLAPDLKQALRQPAGSGGMRYSYDCLGEGAHTRADAERYFESYLAAIRALGGLAPTDSVWAAPGVSIKLSALHPRYEFGQQARLRRELIPRLRSLALAAREAGIGMTLDAEEAERLEPSLDVFEAVYEDRALGDWQGFGLAVQSYQKRARKVVDWLDALAGERGRRIPVRLAKGAYWDAEIKRAQERGLDGYPVFTRKAATDTAYLACVQAIRRSGPRLYGQFATHNAYTASYVLMAYGDRRDYEFQRLHGMGEALYSALNETLDTPVPCRVYAPVGRYEDLLPYLVRRLLENGSNSSFINRLGDESIPVEGLVEDPLARITAVDYAPHPRIPLPADLFGAERRNSSGIDLTDPLAWEDLSSQMVAAASGPWHAQPMIPGRTSEGPARAITAPADRRLEVGAVVESEARDRERALGLAAEAAAEWDLSGAGHRAGCLHRAADLFEAHRAELMALCIREGGRCVADAMSEVREAVDFCRYYAVHAEAEFGEGQDLPGPSGELNRLALRGRGVFLCVSPWNFPLSIFSGQVVAALVAGNAVLAKPARQTPLVAAAVVRLLHRAGIPPEVLHLIPGPGSEIGAQLLRDPRIGGVALTGSTDTAWTLQEALAARRGPIVPLIAETGGQNAMIVDSSALPEQVVADVITSAFNSVGQRCSALRLLFLQTEIADRVLEMLAGAMDELVIGDPMALSTDVGPVIDEPARAALEAHARRMDDSARVVRVLKVPPECEAGTYFAPRVYEIDRIGRLEGEVFGPILHVIRYPADGLDAAIDAINGTGYGLTLGVHSRIESTWERVRRRARAGNLYVNRNMIGAVVGVQPFGGEGLSGTGPKAGGPYYLHRFAVERTLTVNTAAVGGNPELLRGDPSSD